MDIVSAKLITILAMVAIVKDDAAKHGLLDAVEIAQALKPLSPVLANHIADEAGIMATYQLECVEGHTDQKVLDVRINAEIKRLAADAQARRDAARQAQPAPFNGITFPQKAAKA